MKFGIRMARSAARRSVHRKPMGAALLRGNQIIVAHNNPKSAPFTHYYWPYPVGIHAEAALFRGIVPGLGGHVFVYREKKDGSLGISKPCAGCWKILQQNDIAKVTYFDGAEWVTDYVQWE